MSRFGAIALASFCLILVSACDNSQAPTERAANQDDSTSDQVAHDQDNHHSDAPQSYSAGDHSHRHGIHGGHIFDFSPAEFLGEWVQHRDSDLIQIFVLDLNGQSDFPQKVESLLIKKGDTLFSLDPESPDENGYSSVYSLEDKDLSIAMNLGVDVELTIGDREFTAEIPAHAGH